MRQFLANVPRRLGHLFGLAIALVISFSGTAVAQWQPNGNPVCMTGGNQFRSQLMVTVG